MRAKEQRIRYITAFVLLWAAVLLLQIKPAGCVVCMLAFGLFCIGWRRIMNEEMIQQRRLTESALYMEQLLYAFLQNQKILSSLEDIYPLFREGEMKTCIAAVVAHVKQDCHSEIKEELKSIEYVFENDRLKGIHAYLLNVEHCGGEYERTIELLLEDVRNWLNRIHLYQNDCRKYKRNVQIAVALSILVSAITNALLPRDMAVAGTVVCQTASVMVLCIDMLICFRAIKRTGRNWLRSEERETDGNWEKKYYYVRKKQGIKSMLYQKTLSRKMQQSFPIWLMDISLLLQTENVQVALYKTRSRAPKVLRPAITELLEGLNRNPESMEPYMNFLREYNLPDVQSAMRMLYALSTGGYGNGTRQLSQIMQRNQELLDKTERAKNEDALAGLYALFLAPALTGAGKMMIDMAMFLVAFLAQAGM